MTDSVRQAIVRIACKSLTSSSEDVQCEIEKLKEANLLPHDFRLSGSGGGQSRKSANNNSLDLKKCAAQLVESIICKVKQQLVVSQNPSAADLCQTGAKSMQCCMAQRKKSNVSNKQECCDARQQVLQCSLQLLDQQTEAICRDVQRVRQQVAERMVSEVTCGGANYAGTESHQPSRMTSSAKMSGHSTSHMSTDMKGSLSPSRTSTSTKKNTKKSSSRSGSATSAKASSKQISTSTAKSNKKKNSKKNASDKNKSWNAIVNETSEMDSDDDDEDSDETEDEKSEESSSDDDSDDDSSGDEEQRNNSARTKKSKTSYDALLNRNCNAATGSEYDCGGCGGCSGCGSRVASCNVQDVLDRETLCRALQACDISKMPVSEVELRKFAGDVVDSLYAAVRAKLSAMLDDEYSSAGGEDAFPKDELLAKADEEVRTQVLPVVVDHIVWLMKEERRSLGQLDCDMMMIAFAGQFVDTVVTNAVVKTQVDLSGKRAYTRTFVATSNGGSRSKISASGGSGLADGSGIKSILRASKQFANNERVTDIWTRESQMIKHPSKQFSNVSNNCNKLAESSPTRECSFASTCSTECDDHPQKSHPPYLIRTDDRVTNHGPENHFDKPDDYSINNNNNNNKNRHVHDGSSNRNSGEGNYDVCNNDDFICENNAPYSTGCTCCTVYCLSENAFCYYTYFKHWNNNNCGGNYNSNNNRVSTSSDDDNHTGDAIDAAAGDAQNCRASDLQSFDYIIGDCNNKIDGCCFNQAMDNIPRKSAGRTIQKRPSNGNKEEIVFGNTVKSEQLNSMMADDDDTTDLMDEELHLYLSKTVDLLLSASGFHNVAHRALDSAAEWLSRYRDCIHSSCFCDRQRQAYVQAGRALLDQIPLSLDCQSTVDTATRRLFRRAVDVAVVAVYDTEHCPTHDLADDRTSLITRARSLWHQATQTSELLLMKTAIQANCHDSHTLARLLLCRFLLFSSSFCNNRAILHVVRLTHNIRLRVLYFIPVMIIVYLYSENNAIARKTVL